MSKGPSFFKPLLRMEQQLTMMLEGFDTLLANMKRAGSAEQKNLYQYLTHLENQLRVAQDNLKEAREMEKTIRTGSASGG